MNSRPLSGSPRFSKSSYSGSPSDLCQLPVNWATSLKSWSLKKTPLLRVRTSSSWPSDSTSMRSHVARDRAARVVEDHQAVTDVAFPHLGGHAVELELEEGKVITVSLEHVVFDEVALRLLPGATVPEPVPAWAGQVRHGPTFPCVFSCEAIYLAFSLSGRLWLNSDARG